MHNIYILLLLIFLWPGSSENKSDVSLWPAELNTAKNTEYLNGLEQQVIHELNKVRSNPKRYAEDYLEELRDGFNGKLFTYPGQVTVRTQEGIRPLEECIK